MGDVHTALTRWSTALLVVFLADIACCVILVMGTGGSYRSPFSPVFFILPALAFFLRESPHRIVIYTGFICASFSVSLAAHDNREGGESPTDAYWFVSIACLILSTTIGYVTRPH